MTAWHTLLVYFHPDRNGFDGWAGGDLLEKRIAFHHSSLAIKLKARPVHHLWFGDVPYIFYGIYFDSLCVYSTLLLLLQVWSLSCACPLFVGDDERKESEWRTSRRRRRRRCTGCRKYNVTEREQAEASRCSDFCSQTPSWPRNWRRDRVFDMLMVYFNNKMNCPFHTIVCIGDVSRCHPLLILLHRWHLKITKDLIKMFQEKIKLLLSSDQKLEF